MAVAAMAETKKMIINPRVEIDISPPFESVKEAVNLFGGRGPWIPHQLLPLDADQQDAGALDMDKMEEHTAQLERVLITRERETLNVLRELEEAKKLVEGLKVHLLQDSSTFMATPNVKPESNLSAPPTDKSSGMLSLSPAHPPRLELMDLDQARVNLNRTTIDLAVIRASVESLNKMMKKDKGLLERSSEAKVSNSPGVFSAEENHKTSRATLEIEQKVETGNGPDQNSDNISDDHSPFRFEAEQYKKMVEASRYEVMKAMSEIERTKASIRMAEMRLNAARKIEEAAKAVEAIAFAEGKSPLLNGEKPSESHLHKPEEITLPFEEYNFLTYKAKQAEEMCKTKFVDADVTREKNRAGQHPKAYSKDLDQTTKGTYKKNSLEAAFDNEGGFHRRELVEDGFDGQRSDYRKMQYTGYSSAASKFRDSHPSIDRKDSSLLNRNEPNNVKDEAVPVYRSTISIGDVLSRKLILQDDMVMEKHVEAQAERQQVSLSQMLREQSGLIFHHTKSMKDGSSTDRHFFAQKKKFGFIHVVLPKHSKKKAQVLN